MIIHKINLENFRNICSAEIFPSVGVNILFGKNAQGKTNFLESIYFSATSRSHRGSRDKDLICIGSEAAKIRLDIRGVWGENEIYTEIGKSGKKIFINRTQARKLGELYGFVYVAMFSPEDLQLVKAGPQLRRRFMDMELCQIYPSYYHSLRMYYKILKQRNNLLKTVYRNRDQMELIPIFDRQLVDAGQKIISYRKKYISAIEKYAANIASEITNGIEELVLTYKNNVGAEDFEEKLTKHREQDISRGATSVGIHKDDISFRINGRDGRDFASQGQQRTAALSLKLASVSHIVCEKKEQPIILLDDVLSELDAARQEYLMMNISKSQVFITLTGGSATLDMLESHIIENKNVLFVEDGKFTERN